MTSSKHLISVLVENHAGVLSRISGLFARRGFNIDSLAVGITDNPNFSRITIVVVDSSDYLVEQMTKQLNKLIDVIKIKILPLDHTVNRELMLLKLNTNEHNRGSVLDIIKIMECKICDVTASSMTIQICDTTDRLNLTLELLTPYGVSEVVRTGTVALETGNYTINHVSSNASIAKR